MARRLVVLALAAAAAAAAVAATRRLRSTADPARNGGSRERAARLQQELQEARERLRADIVRAREQN
jgi:Spy/CpxP family protein refolding chaperone